MSSTEVTRDHRQAIVLAAIAAHDEALEVARQPFWHESEKWARLEEMRTARPQMARPTSPYEAGELWSFFTVSPTPIADLDGPEWATNRHAVSVEENVTDEVVLSWEGYRAEDELGDVSAWVSRQDRLNLTTGEYVTGEPRIELSHRGTQIETSIADDFEAAAIVGVLTHVACHFRDAR